MQDFFHKKDNQSFDDVKYIKTDNYDIFRVQKIWILMKIKTTQGRVKL